MPTTGSGSLVEGIGRVSMAGLGWALRLYGNAAVPAAAADSERKSLRVAMGTDPSCSHGDRGAGAHKDLTPSLRPQDHLRVAELGNGLGRALRSHGRVPHLGGAPLV